MMFIIYREVFIKDSLGCAGTQYIDFCGLLWKDFNKAENQMKRLQEAHPLYKFKVERLVVI